MCFCYCLQSNSASPDLIEFVGGDRNKLRIQCCRPVLYCLGGQFANWFPGKLQTLDVVFNVRISALAMRKYFRCFSCYIIEIIFSHGDSSPHSNLVYSWSYRTAAPPASKATLYTAEAISAGMWWWVLWHLWHEYEHITVCIPSDLFLFYTIYIYI